MGLRKRFLVVVVGVPGSPAEAQRSEVGRFRSLGAAEEAGRDEWKRILFVHAPHVERYRIVVEDDGVEVADVPMPELPADAAPGILDETVTPLGASVGALGEPIDPDSADHADGADAAGEASEEGNGSAPEAAAADSADKPAVADAPDAADTASGPGSAPEGIQATGELTVVQDEPDELAATGEHKGMADEVAADDVAATGEVPVIASAEDDAPGKGGDGDDPPPAPRPALEVEDPPDGPVPDDIIQRFAQMVEAEEQRAAERSARDRDNGG